LIKDITVMKTIKSELANIKSFLLFFQETISKEINSMTNYPIHYKHLRKQRKL
jgi:hypothetical protein